jgi:hypothetical protein
MRLTTTPQPHFCTSGCKSQLGPIRSRESSSQNKRGRLSRGFSTGPVDAPGISNSFSILDSFGRNLANCRSDSYLDHSGEKALFSSLTETF